MSNGISKKIGDTSRRHPGWLWVIVILLILFSVIKFLPAVIVHWQLNKRLKEQGEQNVQIEYVSFNPITLNLKITSLFAEGQGAGELKWQRVSFNIAAWPLRKRRLVIEDFILRNATITIQRTKTGEYIFGGLRFEAGPDAGRRAWDIGFSNVDHKNVTIIYISPLLKQKMHIDSAHADTFMSWRTDHRTEFTFYSSINGGNISIKGKADPQGQKRTVSMNLNIDSLPLQWLSPVLSRFDIQTFQGILYTNMQINGTIGSDSNYSLNSKGTASLNKFLFRYTFLPFKGLNLPSFLQWQC